MAMSTSWPKIDFTDERLDNGLRLIMSEDRLAPIAAVKLWYNVGSRNEEEGRTGLAHLFEHVMFEGSRNVGKGEHFRLVSSAGGALNGSTWFNRTNYFEWAPSNQLELLLWLEADRMGTLLEAVNQENLDNQRDVVKNERRYSIDNRPYGTWIEKLQNNLYPQGHPYHHEVIGSMEDLSAATLEDVHNFFKTYYAPNNAVVSVVGDFEPERVRGWVQKYFGGIAANPNIPGARSGSLPTGFGGPIREVIPDRVPLSRVYVGFRSPPDGSREADVILMTASLLAIGRGSRLYRRLVRDQQIAQDVQFFSLGFQDVSLTAGWATARPQTNLDELEKAFFEVIESVVNEPATDDELARAKAAVERSVLEHLMNVANKADWLSEHATVFDDPGKVNDRLPSLLSVTAEEIREVASKVLIPDNRVELVYVPGDKQEASS